MAKPSNQALFLSTLLLATTALNFPRATLSDVACQYPCNPAAPATTTTPVPVVSYPTPAGIGGVYPTPGVYYPYTPPPPNYGGGYYGAPPPPDPILPYFPFYYKEPLHRPSPENGNQPSFDDYNSSSTRPYTTTTILAISLVYLLVSLLLLGMIF